MKKIVGMIITSFALLALAATGYTAPVYLSEQHTYGNVSTIAGYNANGNWADPAYALFAPDFLYMPITTYPTGAYDLISYKFSQDVRITDGGPDIVIRELGKDSLTGSGLAAVNLFVSQTGLYGQWYSLVLSRLSTEPL